MNILIKIKNTKIDYKEYLKLKENTKGLKETYDFIFENDLIIIKNVDDGIKFLYTLQWIDEILDKFLREHNETFTLICSENIEDIEDDNRDSKGIRVYDRTNFIEDAVKKLSAFEVSEKTNDYLDIEIDFYSKMEYTNTINLETKRGIANFRVGRVNSHDKLFSMIWVGELKDPVNVRVHYQCETSEVFGSNHCDCKEQLEYFLDKMFDKGNALLIYAHEEGRGLGLFNKNNAYYETQIHGLDTVDAMVKVAGKAENRMFEIPADIIKKMNISEINLWTNNPKKILPIEYRGIKVNRKEAWYECTSKIAKKYMEDKRRRMDHIEKSSDNS